MVSYTGIMDEARLKLGLFSLTWFLAASGILFNAIALLYLNSQRRKKRENFKLDEVVLVSLCSANLLFNLSIFMHCALSVGNDTRIIPSILLSIVAHSSAFTLLVSLSNVLLLSLERFISFAFPFYHREIRKRYLLLVLLLCWLLCTIPTVQLHRERYIYFLTLCGVLVFSNIFIILCYIYIFAIIKKTIRNSTVPVTKSRRKSYYTFIKEKSQMQLKTTVMCLSIVITYFFCTVPPAVWMSVYKGAGISHISDKSAVSIIMYMLLITRTVFDPLVYILRNKLFVIAMIALTRMKTTLKESTSVASFQGQFGREARAEERNQNSQSPYVISTVNESKM